ncbi:hypothetical protein CPB86DRAFT_781017 [Serendipita vermifera]|nr:hypothetical protein CPB86DRAFT_781017 [Serendipita vermifera]
MSFVFQMDVDQKQNQHHQLQHHQQARSPSTPAQDRQPRFLVSYAPKPAQPTTTSPVYRAKAHVVSSVANPANDAIHKWLAAHQTYLPHDQPSSSFDTDSEDEEDEDEEEEEFESESEDEGMMMMMEQAGHSSSSDEDEDDSQLIFVRPRRHNSNNNIHTTSTSLHSTSSPLSRPTKATTPISVVPPTKRTSPVDAPRQRLLAPIVIRTRAGRTGPAPVVTTTESALPSSSSPFHHPISVAAAASPAMTNLLTAARPALPVVSLSAASAVIDLSMPNSHSNERSHWSDDEDLDDDNKEEEEEEEESEEESDEVEEVEDEAQWAMEEEEVPALDVDEEGAPASTSTRSLPIPILASSPLLHAQQQHQRPLKAQGPHISHLRRNRFIRGQRYHLGGDNSHSDEYSDDGMDNSYRPQFEDEDMWDTSYQSPPTRKSTRQTYNIVHQDGQSFYGPWMNEYFTGVSVRD